MKNTHMSKLGPKKKKRKAGTGAELFYVTFYICLEIQMCH